MDAQATEAGIFGVILGQRGNALAGADITATNENNGLRRTAKSLANGEYSIKALPLGSYDVAVQLPGFRQYVQSGVLLDVNRNARVDAVLEVGPVTESITVSADAPLVDLSNAQLGRTVDNQEITRLALVNRDVYALLNLTPGVEMNVTANTVGFRQTTAAINGSGDGGIGSVAYFLDGGPNMTGLRNTGNSTPNPDTIEEFRVITNGYSAEFGRFPAGVVDVVTKSGTNEFHGSLFEYLRNDALDAKDWRALSKPPQRRNQFGGSAGVPLRKNKLFLFASYSGLRQRFQDVLNGAVVPTALERTGDFSASSKTPSGAGTVGGVISHSALDPTALTILSKYIPAANLPGNMYQGAVPRPSNSDDGNFKLDYNASAEHALMLSYFVTKGFEYQKAGGDIPWSQQDYTWQQHNVNMADTWVAAPNTVNQLHLSYVRNFGGRLNLPNLSLADLGSDFTIQGVKSLPQITVNGYFTLFEAIQGPIAGSNDYGVRDSFSVIRGKHSINLGGELSLEKSVQDTSLNNYGVWTFDGSKTGNALADFLTGIPASFKQDAPITKIDNEWYRALFVQDDFRVSRRFTVNLGLRYELPGAELDPHNRKLTFAPGVQSTVAPHAPIGLLFPGDPGVSRGIIRPSKTMFAPRAGFAWDPFGRGKTSIRGGAGIYYGSISSNDMNMTADFQPFAARQTFPAVKTLSDPYGNLPGGSPFPISYDPQNLKFAFQPADVSTLAQNFHFPRTYQLSFSIEQQLASDYSVSAAYVGSLARHLPFTVDRNYASWTPGATAANLSSRRPYLPGTLGIINYEDGIINSDYHGLQMSVRKQMKHGLAFQAYYTFSKSLAGAQTQNNTPTGGAEDFRNLSLERSRTDNDRRHNFTLSAIWYPNYSGGSRIGRNLLNGWSLSVIATARSGAPLTCLSGQDTNLDGSATDRCDVIGDPSLSPNRPRSQAINEWFNTGDFRAPAIGSDGNSARNLLDGPGLKDVDLAIMRDFRIRERATLELRADFTNALNLVNLSAPNMTFNSPAFGTISAAGPMRQSQIGIRLFW
jgi:Carboxypeptidase regulatory-like domain/TonB-dependent Receptor Plug Domain